MILLLTRAKSFHKPDGNRGASDSVVTLSPGQVEAPEWVRDTNTFRAGVADGSIRNFSPEGSGIFVPTKEQLVDKGYAPEVADEIVIRQRELAAQFTSPEPPEKVEHPADLEALGLTGGVLEPVQVPVGKKKAAKAK